MICLFTFLIMSSRRPKTTCRVSISHHRRPKTTTLPALSCLSLPLPYLRLMIASPLPSPPKISTACTSHKTHRHDFLEIIGIFPKQRFPSNPSRARRKHPVSKSDANPVIVPIKFCNQILSLLALEAESCSFKLTEAVSRCHVAPSVRVGKVLKQ